MLRTFGRCASLSSLLVLSVISALVRSQAPGDASQSCTKESVPDDAFRLLDSNWYKSLLSEQTESAGWTQTPADSWTTGGNNCGRRLKSCDPSSTNWLVTQYIDKSVDVSYDLEITVDILGNTESCTGCNSDAIEIRYYPSNGEIGSGQQLVAGNYNPVGTLTFSGAASTKSIIFFLGSGFDRFYIAIVAEDVCFTLRRLRVSYKLCVAKTEDLVVYPNTPIGSVAVTTFASCDENGAALSPGSSLEITCETSGTYSGSPSCSCAGGYFLHNDICEACAAGTFSKAGATMCTKCPDNTDSPQGAESCDCIANYYWDSESCIPCPANSLAQPGSLTCDCVSGYFRTSTESGSFPCTTAPSKPSGLSSTSMNDTTVSLSWTEPTDHGGRPDDLFYVVRYKTLQHEFVTYNTSLRIKSVSVIVSGLSPNTFYTFVVIAENNVTQEFPNDFEVESRSSMEIDVQTEPSPVPPPGKLMCDVVNGIILVWTPPEGTIEDIMKYDIDISGYIISIPDHYQLYYVPEKGLFTGSENGGIQMKVNAVNSAGTGEYCDPVTISYCAFAMLINASNECPDVNISILPTSTTSPETCPPSSNNSPEPSPPSSNDSTESAVIRLEGNVLYGVVGAVALLIIVLIAILVILCCWMRFKKKDVYLTRSIISDKGSELGNLVKDS